MKKKYVIAIVATVVFMGAAAGFALNSSGQQDIPANTNESSDISTLPSLIVGDISLSPIQSNPGQDAASEVDGTGTGTNEKNSTNTNLTSLPSKPTSAPPPPAVDGAGGVDSNGNPIKATNPALLDKDNPPSYTSQPVIDGGSKPSSSSSNSKPTNNNSSKPSVSSGSNSSKPSSSSSKPTTSTPNAGDTKDGKTYVPGFGWVDGTGGGQGEATSGAWGGDEQIGIME